MRTHSHDILLSPGLAEALMNFLPGGLLMVNLDGIVVNANAAASQYMGCESGEELRNKSIRDLFVCHEQLTRVLNMTAGSERLQGEAAFRRLDDTISNFIYECVWQPAGNGLQDMILVFLHHQELNALTIQAKLNETTSMLQQKTRDFDEFTYIVSHDLKAPMRAISNLSSWIEEDLLAVLTEESKNNLALLRNRVSRMESLMNGLSAYSKIGREVVHIENVDARTLIQDAIRSLSPPDHISVRIDGDMPVLSTSRKMLLLVFTHLIDNAIKHNDKPCVSVVISAKALEDMYTFEVSDNGPGIAAENHELIFAMFRTLQSRDKFESAGVGLPIVRRILDNCGGSIVIESEPGQGSRFIVRWPVGAEKKLFVKRGITG